MDQDKFETTIIQGIQRLYTLSLPGTPASETITATTKVWVDVIAHHAHWQDADMPRLEAAFKLLERSAERWPLPRHFLDQIPKRAAERMIERKLTEADRERAQEVIDSIKTMSTKRLDPRKVWERALTLNSPGSYGHNLALEALAILDSGRRVA